MTFPALLLNDRQRRDWLRLLRSESVGPRTFRVLLDQHGNAAAALAALPEIARKAGRRIKIASEAKIDLELELARRLNVRFVAMGEADYPVALRVIDSAPPLIAIRGECLVLRQPAVAIVGSRNASAAGLKFAEHLGRSLGEAGYAVVSGLARGIDAAVHRASLTTGTIAVLAGGHDRLYPPEHAKLLDELLERGAAISEMPMGWVPRGRDFPRRNRIVSGSALGVIVVEAARRSGSLITARFALEQGREVFAVPGSPLDPRAEGTNDLIRQGATLVADADHVLSVLAPLRESPPLLEEGRPGEEREPLWDELALPGVLPAPAETLPHNLEEAAAEAPLAPSGNPHDVIVGLLDSTPIAVDELVRASGLRAGEVQVVLLDLEMSGRLERHGGQAVSLVPPDPGS